VSDTIVVNQFTVSEDRKTRQPDIVVFINGILVRQVKLVAG
jgi:type I site-specific restriction-modification system R (restriction) subunit